MNAPDSYDELPYRSRPRRPTQPETLAALATLKGYNPAAVTATRMLEIGCGTGGNLIAAAHLLPGGTFLGIDPAPVQIEIARRDAAELGLTNIRFEAIGVGDLPADAGPFDAIVAHGVYSWVPPAVREQVLAVCRRTLAPHGAAMISFNVLPGWHLRQFSRDAMLAINAGPGGDAATRVRRGRGYMKFLADAIPDRDSTWCRVVSDEFRIVAGGDDFYLFHEHLSEYNQPCYFAEFMARAAAHGLQYLDDAWHHPVLAGLPAATVELLERISQNRIELEQHVDYIRCRAFRHTVLMRDDAAAAGFTPAVLERMMIRAAATPVSDLSQRRLDGNTTYRNLHDVEMTTASPAVNAVLQAVGPAFPLALTPAEVRARVSERLTRDGLAPPENWDARWDAAVRDLYHSQFVTLHTWQPAMATVPSARPRAWAVARQSARHDRRVPSLTQQTVELSAAEHAVFPALDGTRSQEELAALLAAQTVPDLAAPPTLAPILARFASHGLLVA